MRSCAHWDAGIQHRVWMTGKPARAWVGAAQARTHARCAAYRKDRTYVLLTSRDGGIWFWRWWWARLVIELRSPERGARRGDRALRPMAMHRRGAFGARRGPSSSVGTTIGGRDEVSRMRNGGAGLPRRSMASEWIECELEDSFCLEAGQGFVEGGDGEVHVVL